MKPSNFESYLKSTNVRNINLTFRLLNILFTFGQWIYPKGIEDFVRKKFFTPVAKPLTKKQEDWINRATSIKIPFGDRKLAAWKIGQGPSILFVHGWNGRGVQFHHFFQPTLEAGYSIIFFDAPAHGLSDGATTNYLEVTESVEAIFTHKIGKDIVGVIAHSMGVSVIINHMSRHHHQIPLVFIAPALRLMELLFASFQLHGVPKQTYLKLVREVEEKYQIPLETQNPIDLIYHLRNDMLIIHDTGDRTTPIGPSKRVENDLENIELIETTGLGHSFIVRDKTVIDHAMDFLLRKETALQNMSSFYMNV